MKGYYNCAKEKRAQLEANSINLLNNNSLTLPKVALKRVDVEVHIGIKEGSTTFKFHKQRMVTHQRKQSPTLIFFFFFFG